MKKWFLVSPLNACMSCDVDIADQFRKEFEGRIIFEGDSLEDIIKYLQDLMEKDPHLKFLGIQKKDLN
jgi:hypothetical protein